MTPREAHRAQELSRLLGTTVTTGRDRGVNDAVVGRITDDGGELLLTTGSGSLRLVAVVDGVRMEVLVPDAAVAADDPPRVESCWLDKVRLAVAGLRLGRTPLADADALERAVDQTLGRHEAVGRYSMSLEYAVDEYVRTHREDGLRRYLSAHPIVRDVGRLADGDRLRGLKDLMISILAVATRSATDAGTNVPVAFGISDYFIREFERAGNEDEVDRVLLRALRALADSVAMARHLGRSALVRACEAWILTHLDGVVRPSAAAAALGVRQDYLVAQFRRETGMRFAEYVLSRKVDETRALLTHTDLPVSEICRRLGFYDQSHLIRVFRRYAQDTPKRYRMRTRRLAAV